MYLNLLFEGLSLDLSYSIAHRIKCIRNPKDIRRNRTPKGVSLIIKNPIPDPTPKAQIISRNK